MVKSKTFNKDDFRLVLVNEGTRANADIWVYLDGKNPLGHGDTEKHALTNSLINVLTGKVVGVFNV